MSLHTSTRSLERLYRAIITDPSNLDLRLVYADLLEESDYHERAELIRVQIELGGRTDDGRKHSAAMIEELAKREQELLVQSAQWCEGQRMSLLFSNGFPDIVSCSQEDWMRWGYSVVRSAPVVYVILLDTEPAKLDYERCYWTDRHNRPIAIGEHNVAGRIFSFIKLKQMLLENYYPIKVAENVREAKDALSAACIAFARG